MFDSEHTAYTGPPFEVAQTSPDHKRRNWSNLVFSAACPMFIGKKDH